MAILLLALVALTIRGVLDAGDSARDSTSRCRVSAPAAPGVVPTPGLSSRFFPTVAWTESGLFVYGGIDECVPRLLDDVALVDVRTGEVDALPGPPFREPLAARQAIAVDGSVVLVGTLCGGRPDLDDIATCAPGTYAGAVFDGSRRQWREVALPGPLVAAPPASVTILGATSDGRAVIVLGNDAHNPSETAVAEYWTYRVAGDAWERVPDPGVSGAAACLAQDELFVVTARYLERGAGIEASFTMRDLAGEGAWHSGTPEVMDLPMADSSWQAICAAGRAAVVSTIDSLGYTFLYDPATDSWSAAPPAPVQQFIGRRLAAGDRLLYLPGEGGVGEPGLAYDLSDGAWTLLEGLPPLLRGAVWSGNALVGYDEPLRTPGGVNEPGVYRYVPTG